MKNIFIAALLTLSAPALAQVPQWALHPEYSSIKLLGNEHYVVSKNGKYGILRKEAAKSNGADVDFLGDESFISDMEAMLEAVVTEMLDTNIPFVQAEDDKKCSYCEFKLICKR